jgi:uncharacterized surface protein with fasciclin (FAS1) repeats
MKIRTWVGIWVGLLFLGSLRASAQGASGSVMDIAAAMPELSTWVQAVRAAGLEKSLSGPGSFTVFAPSDVAFSSLLPGALEDLLKPENKQRLLDILNVHLARRSFGSSQLAGKKSVESMGRKLLRISSEGHSLRVADALIAKADLSATNGVVHIIDKVIMP